MKNLKTLLLAGIFIAACYIAGQINYQNSFMVRSECAWEKQEISYNTKENPTHLVMIKECNK